jgi:hypothetical protein
MQPMNWGSAFAWSSSTSGLKNHDVEFLANRAESVGGPHKYSPL